MFYVRVCSFSTKERLMQKQIVLPSCFQELRITCTTVIYSLLISLGLTACSGEQASAPETAVSLSPRLEQLFLQTCANCHTRPETGAPLAGYHPAWQKILDKGLDVTLENTINGYGGMPPGGQCFECTPEDLRQLILFMAQASSDKPLVSKPGDNQ